MTKTLHPEYTENFIFKRTVEMDKRLVQFFKERIKLAIRT